MFYEIEMPLMKVLARMEQNGVLIDSEALLLSSVVLTGEMIELEKQIHELANMNLMCNRRRRWAKFFLID